MYVLQYDKYETAGVCTRAWVGYTMPVATLVQASQMTSAAMALCMAT